MWWSATFVYVEGMCVNVEKGRVAAAYIFTWMQLKHVTSGSQYDLNIYTEYPLYECVWHGLTSRLFKRNYGILGR